MPKITPKITSKTTAKEMVQHWYLTLHINTSKSLQNEAHLTSKWLSRCYAVDKVKMWSKHISDVAKALKLGAKKAAATRRRKDNFKGMV